MADSGPFIDFMLGEILKTLEAHRETQVQPVPNKVPNKLQSAFPDIPALAWQVYSLLRADGHLTTAQMADALGVSDRMVRKHLALLKAERLIMRVGSNKTGYWKVMENFL